MRGDKLDYAVGGATAALAAPGVAKTAAVAVLKTGFSSIGPVANSWAAGWMSTAALANGGAVAPASTYAVVQQAAMTMPFFSPVAALAVAGGATFFGVRWLARRWS